MLFWKKKKPSHERAMDWFKQHMVPGQGIIVHTMQPKVYPQGTDFFIPTLICGCDRSNPQEEGNHA